MFRTTSGHLLISLGGGFDEGVDKGKPKGGRAVGSEGPEQKRVGKKGRAEAAASKGKDAKDGKEDKEKGKEDKDQRGKNSEAAADGNSDDSDEDIGEEAGRDGKQRQPSTSATNKKKGDFLILFV